MQDGFIIASRYRAEAFFQPEFAEKPYPMFVRLHESLRIAKETPVSMT
jgi:hypothetical protein